MVNTDTKHNVGTIFIHLYRNEPCHTSSAVRNSSLVPVATTLDTDTEELLAAIGRDTRSGVDLDVATTGRYGLTFFPSPL